ncbi:hypothetical protein IFR05_000073 [Cadophora sp. M221]|nr:hypothetical protein IFR05_000073 [Cadophora sp. M221]
MSVRGLGSGPRGPLVPEKNYAIARAPMATLDPSWIGRMEISRLAELYAENHTTCRVFNQLCTTKLSVVYKSLETHIANPLGDAKQLNDDTTSCGPGSDDVIVLKKNAEAIILAGSITSPTSSLPKNQQGTYSGSVKITVDAIKFKAQEFNAVSFSNQGMAVVIFLLTCPKFLTAQLKFTTQDQGN